MSYIKLMFYKSRWYSPELGRFAQPDTIVAEPGSSQGYNRYSYVGNNPINNVDPSGRSPKKMTEEDIQSLILNQFGIYLDSGGWSVKEGRYILEALHRMADGLDKILFGGGVDWIIKNLGGTHISVGFDKWKDPTQKIFFGTNPHTIGSTVYMPANFLDYTYTSPYGRADTMLVHELGHVWDNRSAGKEATVFGGGASDALMNVTGGHSSALFGIRCAENSLDLNGFDYPFNLGDGFGYGNNSPADYFAQVFAATIMTPNDWHTPPLAELWMAALIVLTK